MTEDEREDCDERPRFGQDGHQQKRRGDINQEGGNVSQPTVTQEKLKCMVGWIVDGKSVAAHCGFRIPPETLRLAENRKHRAEKHGANHDPAKALRSPIAARFGAAENQFHDSTSSGHRRFRGGWASSRRYASRYHNRASGSEEHAMGISRPARIQYGDGLPHPFSAGLSQRGSPRWTRRAGRAA